MIVSIYEIRVAIQPVADRYSHAEIPFLAAIPNPSYALLSHLPSSRSVASAISYSPLNMKPGSGDIARSQVINFLDRLRSLNEKATRTSGNSSPVFMRKFLESLGSVSHSKGHYWYSEFSRHSTIHTSVQISYGTYMAPLGPSIVRSSKGGLPCGFFWSGPPECSQR